MTREELFKLHKDTCESCLKTLKKKNHDYNPGVSPFATFRASSMVGVTPVQLLLARCIDKFQRIISFDSGNGLWVEGEGVDDAISDVINYMILLKGMCIEDLEDKEKCRYTNSNVIPVVNWFQESFKWVLQRLCAVRSLWKN